MESIQDICIELRRILSPILGCQVDEIDLSVGGPGLKPGGGRKFPQDQEGGHSVNLSVDDGPHMFPDEDSFV